MRLVCLVGRAGWVEVYPGDVSAHPQQQHQAAQRGDGVQVELVPGVVPAVLRALEQYSTVQYSTDSAPCSVTQIQCI